MNQRIILSSATIEDIDFIVEIKTNPSIWIYEDDISTNGDAVRKNAVERFCGNWYNHYIIQLNIPEKNLSEKLGMIREGIFREELLWQGKWVNQFFYCILDNEYRKINISN